MSTTMKKKWLSPWCNPVDRELAVSALAAYPTLEQAKEYMESQGYVNLSVAAMNTVLVNRREDVADRRKELAPQREGRLADNLLSIAERASETTNLAVEHCMKLLEAGKVQDPSKMARDLQQVTTQAVDKRLALQGRPTTIVEKRNVDELVRALESLGVAQQADVTVAAIAEG
jgi:hypothetical protein